MKDHTMIAGVVEKDLINEAEEAGRREVEERKMDRVSIGITKAVLLLGEVKKIWNFVSRLQEQVQLTIHFWSPTVSANAVFGRAIG